MRPERPSSSLLPSCLCLIALLVAACTPSQTSVPVALRGTWVTSGDGFEGRSLMIGEQQITFMVEGHPPDEHHVLGLYSEAEGRELICSLDYLDSSGAEYRLHLRYDLFSGELRLAGRQQVIWEKVET